MVGSEGNGLPQLSEFDEILTIARRQNVIRLKWGKIEVLFGPPEQKGDEKAGSPEARFRKQKRDHYEILLGRQIDDKELDRMPDHFS